MAAVAKVIQTGGNIAGDGKNKASAATESDESSFEYPAMLNNQYSLDTVVKN